MLAITPQYSGPDKWELELKTAKLTLRNRRWKGNSSMTLDYHYKAHRNSLVMMTACSYHLAYQLPNELSRVSFLLDLIKSSDPGLQAALVSL